MIHAPYSTTTVNPDLCYGRDSLVQDLSNGLLRGIPVSYAISGARRIGKTTFLRRLEASLPQKWAAMYPSRGFRLAVVYIDGQTLPQSCSADDLWSMVWSEYLIAWKLPIGVASGTLDFAGFKSRMSNLLSGADRGDRLVVIFDEMERVLASSWAKSFLGHWRALLSNTQGVTGRISAVFAGALELSDLRHDVGSPLANILTWKTLSCLDRTAINDLCQLPIERTHSAAFLDAVFEQTGGHPMLAQGIMQRICDEDTPTFDCVTAERTATRFVQENRWQFDVWWNKYCSDIARAVFGRVISSNYTGVSRRSLVEEFGAHEVEIGIEVLTHVGMIRSEHDPIMCAGAMFSNWYAAHVASMAHGSHDQKICEASQTQTGLNSTQGKPMQSEDRDVVKFLAEQFNSRATARNVWQFAGGSASEVPEVEDMRALWTELWRKAGAGAIVTQERIVAEALSSYPGNDKLLTWCMLHIDSRVRDLVEALVNMVAQESPNPTAIANRIQLAFQPIPDLTPWAIEVSTIGILASTSPSERGQVTSALTKTVKATSPLMETVKAGALGAWKAAVEAAVKAAITAGMQ